MTPVSTRPELGAAVAVTRWSWAATATAAVSVLALAVLAALPTRRPAATAAPTPFRNWCCARTSSSR